MAFKALSRSDPSWAGEGQGAAEGGQSRKKSPEGRGAVASWLRQRLLVAAAPATPRVEAAFPRLAEGVAALTIVAEGLQIELRQLLGGTRRGAAASRRGAICALDPELGDSNRSPNQSLPGAGLC